MATVNPTASEKQPSIWDQVFEAGRNVKFYRNWKFWMTVIVVPVLYWLLDGAVLSPLRQIPGQTKQLAKLERVPGVLDTLDQRTVNEFKSVDSRIDGLAKEVALLNGLPDRMTLLSGDVSATKNTVAELAKETREISKSLDAYTKRLDKSDSTIADASSKLDQLQKISDAVAKLGPQSGRSAPDRHIATTTIRVTLSGSPQTIGESGKFSRLRFNIPTDEIPILNQRDRLTACVINSAEIRSSKTTDLSRFTVEPRLYADDFRLELVVWLGGGDKFPPTETGEYYVLLTVSWPGR